MWPFLWTINRRFMSSPKGLPNSSSFLPRYPPPSWSWSILIVNWIDDIAGSWELPLKTSLGNHLLRDCQRHHIPMTGFRWIFWQKLLYIFNGPVYDSSLICVRSPGTNRTHCMAIHPGYGGGALLSTSQAILFDAFKPEDRPMVSGL